MDFLGDRELGNDRPQSRETFPDFSDDMEGSFPGPESHTMDRSEPGRAQFVRPSSSYTEPISRVAERDTDHSAETVAPIARLKPVDMSREAIEPIRELPSPVRRRAPMWERAKQAIRRLCDGAADEGLDRVYEAATSLGEQLTKPRRKIGGANCSPRISSGPSTLAAISPAS